MEPVIPKELIRPGLTWGVGKRELFAYAETKKDLVGVPDIVSGLRVIKRVVGKILPAG